MFSLKNESKKIKISLLIISLIFFALCMISIFCYGNSTLLGNINNPDNDDVKFIRSSWILVEKGIYVYHNPPTPTVFMMPGLPFTFALFTLIFGKMTDIVAFRILQAVVQTLSLYLIFFIGRKVFNSKVGIIATVLDLFYIAEIYVTNLILTETFFKFFILLLIYFSIYALEKNKTKYYVAGGIFWALATYFRPTIATYPIIILIMWIIMKYSFKDILKNTAIVVGVFCVLMSPWWIRNYRVFHKFIPLTLATGNPMLQGTYINYDQEKSHKTDGLDYAQFKYPAGNEIDNNKVEMKISKYRLKNLVPKHPFKFLAWYTLGKTYNQLNYPFYWKEIFGENFYIAGFYHLVLIVFSIIASIKLLFIEKLKNKAAVVLSFVTIYFVVVYLPFYAFQRYYYPAMPYVMILTASLVLKIIEKDKELRAKQIKD